VLSTRRDRQIQSSRDRNKKPVRAENTGVNARYAENVVVVWNQPMLAAAYLKEWQRLWAKRTITRSVIEKAPGVKTEYAITRIDNDD
jgi:hypothetical protein